MQLATRIEHNKTFPTTSPTCSKDAFAFYFSSIPSIEYSILYLFDAMFTGGTLCQCYSLFYFPFLLHSLSARARLFDGKKSKNKGKNKRCYVFKLNTFSLLCSLLSRCIQIYNKNNKHPTTHRRYTRTNTDTRVHPFYNK